LVGPHRTQIKINNFNTPPPPPINKVLYCNFVYIYVHIRGEPTLPPAGRVRTDGEKEVHSFCKQPGVTAPTGLVTLTQHLLPAAHVLLSVRPICP